MEFDFGSRGRQSINILVDLIGYGMTNDERND